MHVLLYFTLEVKIDAVIYSLQRTPLFAACEEGNIGCVLLLVDYGCDFLRPDRNRNTPKDVAIARGLCASLMFTSTKQIGYATPR